MKTQTAAEPTFTSGWIDCRSGFFSVRRSIRVSAAPDRSKKRVWSKKQQKNSVWSMWKTRCSLESEAGSSLCSLCLGAETGSRFDAGGRNEQSEVDGLFHLLADVLLLFDCADRLSVRQLDDDRQIWSRNSPGAGSDRLVYFYDLSAVRFFHSFQAGCPGQCVVFSESCSNSVNRTLFQLSLR